MAASPKSPPISRRAVVRLLAALPFLSLLGLSQPRARAGEFIELDGWILKRSDLRRKGGR